MKWIKNTLSKIKSWLIWAFTVEEEVPEPEQEDVVVYDEKYFADIDQSVLNAKMLNVYGDIAAYLTGITSKAITYGIKYFNIEQIDVGDYTIINRINEIQRSMCLTKVSTINNKDTGEKEFVTTYNIFNKDSNNDLVKITLTTYLKSISFNNKDRSRLFEASRILANGFMEAQEIDNITRYTNTIDSFKEVNELTRKELNVEVNTYGNMGDFQTTTLMQYINSEECEIIGNTDDSCKYSCHYIEEPSMVFDIIRKEVV
nr:MAG TPA: hypothetical protein [Caudoviricetes sp.]